MPILWTLQSTLRPWGEVLGGPLLPSLESLTLQNYIDVFRRGQIFTFLRNSTMYGGFSAILCATISLLAGYSLSRFDLPGKKYILSSFVFVMMIPVLVVLVPIYFMLVTINFANRVALVLIYAAGNTPLVVWLSKTYIDSIPKDLDEAAHLDGCNKYQTLRYIIFPLATPVFISAIIIVFVNGWSELMYAMIILDRVAFRPITSGILGALGQYGNQWDMLNTMAMLASLPVLILFLFLQRYFIGGIVSGSVKG